MNIRKIEIESVIKIYRHDHSYAGFAEYACTKSSDCYPNPKKGLQAVVDHLYSWVIALETAGEFGGLPLAMPDTMIPGETSHYSADLTLTVYNNSGDVIREFHLDEPVDIDEVRYEANGLLSSVGHQPLIFP